MIRILKGIGKGLLYIVAFPLLILIVVLYGVVGLAIFFFLLIKSVILFFKGKTIFSDLPEDIEAKRIITNQTSNTPAPQTIVENNNVVEEKQDSQLSLYPSDSTMYRTEFHDLNEYKRDEAKPETSEPEPSIVNEEPQIKEELIKEEKIEIHEEKEEPIGIYKPLNSNSEGDN